MKTRRAPEARRIAAADRPGSALLPTTIEDGLAALPAAVGDGVRASDPDRNHENNPYHRGE